MCFFFTFPKELSVLRHYQRAVWSLTWAVRKGAYGLLQRDLFALYIKIRVQIFLKELSNCTQCITDKKWCFVFVRQSISGG